MKPAVIAAAALTPVAATVVYGRAIGLTWREIPWLPLVPILYGACHLMAWNGDRNNRRRQR